MPKLVKIIKAEDEEPKKSPKNDKELDPARIKLEPDLCTITVDYPPRRLAHSYNKREAGGKCVQCGKKF
jgi:hypothetical protein